MRGMGSALEKILGLTLVVSAALKAVDWMAFAAQVSHYGVAREPWVVGTAAVGIIGLEAALGLAILQGLASRRAALPAALALLAGFTALIGWAWVFRDLENCGCFGKFLPMEPFESILKNLLMMAIAWLAWLRLAREKRQNLASAWTATAGEERIAAGQSCAWAIRRRHVPPLTVSMLGAAAFMGFAVVGPFGQSEREEREGVGSGSGLGEYSVKRRDRRFDLGDGVYLVGLLSDACAHCAEDVAQLNELNSTAELPPVVGLILGEADTLEQFREDYRPQFPNRLIPVLEFFDLIGDAPPRVYLTHNGVSVAFWDSKIPDGDVVRGAMWELKDLH